MQSIDCANVPYDIVYPIMGWILDGNKKEYVFDENEQYFTIGSYPLSRYVKKKSPKSVFSLDDYTFKDWYKIFGAENMLNPNPQFALAKDIKWINEEMFVRPLLDNKDFNGGIFNKNTLKFEGECVAATLQTINKEFRFFILDGKVIAKTQYKQNGELFESSLVDEGAISFVKEMIKKFNFEGYVIDVALVNETYKIVELNCLNASGFYSIDLYHFLNEILIKYGV